MNNELLRETALALYLGVEMLSNLHCEVELEGNDGKVEACAHCSALADGIVAYPCPTVQILLTDVIEEATSVSETSESPEPSA
jgi:hypothetical protein